MTRTTTTLAAGLLAVGLTLTTTACSDTGSSDAAEARTVTIQDTWVKSADSGMTAAFGTLRNSSDQQVRIVKASTSVSSSMELHEMATDDSGSMVMRPKKGGFVIPADGTHQLSPGGDHLMFMDVTKAVRPGDRVKVTLTFDDDSSMSFTAPARSFSGAEEKYDPGTGESGDMSGMDMS